ncbi:MAG TPA: hypothetical protein VFQ50_09915, partial [Flavobacterium sp.]|nr:hypothetical protein [Flavobacterium sp.]
MKYSLLLIMLMLAPVSWCQQQHYFSNQQVPLTSLLGQIERKFDVKYSYADSLVTKEHVIIESKEYSLQ